MQGYLNEILSQLDNGGMTRNELSILTGLTNSYLVSLGQGSITKVGRDKLIFIGVAFNLSIVEINKLLSEHRFAEISEEDNHIFIEAAKRRKVRGIQKFQRGMNFDLLIISLERVRGKEVLVSTRPSSRFKPEGTITYESKKGKVDNSVYHNLREAFLEERKKILEITLENYGFHQLICKKCLKNYIIHCGEAADGNPEEADIIRGHFRNLLANLGQQNFQIDLIKGCPSFEFIIKFSDEADEKDKAYFTGGIKKHSDGYGFDEDGVLGFATDVDKIVKHFKFEYERLKGSIISEYSNPDRLRDYIEQSFKSIGIDRI